MSSRFIIAIIKAAPCPVLALALLIPEEASLILRSKLEVETSSQGRNRKQQRGERSHPHPQALLGSRGSRGAGGNRMGRLSLESSI